MTGDDDTTKKLYPDELRSLAASNISQLNNLYMSLAEQMKKHDSNKDQNILDAIRELEQARKHFEQTKFSSIAEKSDDHMAQLSEAQMTIERLNMQNQIHQSKRRHYQLMHVMNLVQLKMENTLASSFTRLVSFYLANIAQQLKQIRKEASANIQLVYSLPYEDSSYQPFAAVKEMLTQEQRHRGNLSSLGEIFSEHRSANPGKSMSVDRMFEMLEGCMNAKLIHDTEALEDGRLPDNNEAFFLSYFAALYDTESLLKLQVVKLIRTLEGIAQMDHSYAKQLCRFFNVIEPEPYLPSVSSFYNLMRAKLDTAKAESERRSIDSYKKPSTDIKAEKACMLIISLFAMDIEACTAACKALNTFMTDLQLSAVLLKCLCEKAEVSTNRFCGTLPEMVTLQDLVSISSKSLGINFNPRLLSGLILPNKRVARHQIKNDLDHFEMTLTKSQVLEAFVSGYTMMLEAQGQRLLERFTLTGGKVTYEDFHTVAIETFPFLSPEATKQLYMDRVNDEANLTPEEACIALTSKLGASFPDSEGS